MLDQSTTNSAYFYKWLIPHEQWTDVHYLETVAALYLETVIGCVQLHAALTKRCKAARYVQAACVLYLHTRAVSTSQPLAVIIR